MKKSLWIIIFLAILVCFYVGWLVKYEQDKGLVPKTEQIRESSPVYQYIKPLILVDNSNVYFPELNPLKNIIAAYISNAKQSGEAEDVSVYYRDMNTGKWTGVNENDLYAPSSMLKVGILMAYLKIAVTDPDVLNEMLLYKPTDDSSQFFKPKQLSAGEYSVRDLLVQMIEQSDNDALTALNNAHPQELVNVFNALNIPYPLVSTPKNFMSPEIYSRMFRTLYNATYLPDIYSEEAFKLLSLTDFNQGIVAGVSTSTTVAHKFGEQTNATNGTVTDRELHDCGIVYYPSHPYFLCVMTKGQDFPILSKIISDISKSVFNYISSKNQ